MTTPPVTVFRMPLRRAVNEDGPASTVQSNVTCQIGPVTSRLRSLVVSVPSRSPLTVPVQTPGALADLSKLSRTGAFDALAAGVATVATALSRRAIVASFRISNLLRGLTRTLRR